ncbi:NHL repeat-containing protein, partial [bacterium]|nr:NHL repeat-containing protein [bacterium]
VQAQQDEGEASTDNPSPVENINQELQNKKARTIELDLNENKPKFSLLRSQNPEDYKRTEGIWISDSGNGRIIYMKNIEGEDFYPLGLNGTGLGRFLNPEQIWVDIKGTIYIADRGNNRIVRIDDIRGVGWQEMNNGFNAPCGVAFHGKRLIVSDTDNDRILVYENFGDTIPMAEFKDSKISKPGYLWLDLEGNIYVCCDGDSPQGRVVRIPYDLTIPPSQWATYKGKGLSGVTFSPTQFIQIEDDYYFVESSNNRLVKIDNFRGRNSLEIGSYGKGNNQFLEPKGLSQDKDGHLYIADMGNDRLVYFDPQPNGKWKAYDTAEPNFGLRSPKSVFVWSPRPEPSEEDEENKDEENKDKEKK